MPGSNTATHGGFISTTSGREWLTRMDEKLWFVNAAAFRIFSQAAPTLSCDRLWQLLMLDLPTRELHKVSTRGINYGGTYASLHVMASEDGDEDEEDIERREIDQWMMKLLKKEAPSQEDHREMMLGKGRMWAYVRPDGYGILSC
jgi:hypothetical protein